MVGVTVGSAHAPEVPEVTDVNWTVNQGEFWAVGGLPGSGKSDFLATAAGLLKPLHGTLRLFGKETAALSESELVQERLRTGFVFSHEGRLFSHLSIIENVALPYSYHHNRPLEDAFKQVEPLLHLVELGFAAFKMPSSLPRHLRIRAALARALAINPEVLFLDDPLKGLDAGQTRWWLELLRRLCNGEGSPQSCKMTVAVATDNFRPWAAHAHCFALIKDHRWHPLGPRESLPSSKEPLLHELLN